MQTSVTQGRRHEGTLAIETETEGDEIKVVNDLFGSTQSFLHLRPHIHQIAKVLSIIKVVKALFIFGLIQWTYSRVVKRPTCTLLFFRSGVGSGGGYFRMMDGRCANSLDGKIANKKNPKKI